MNAGREQRKIKRIVALFPQLGGVGGIQEAGRLTACGLNQIARRFGWSTEFISLNDPSGPQSFCSSEIEISYRGFERSKIEFARVALLLARGGTRIVLAAHPHLALPGAQMKLMNSRLKLITISHGIEIWAPLSRLRRIAFHRSDLFVAPSRYTAEKVAQEQGVPEDRIRRLPWPLNPEIRRMAEHPEHLPLPRDFPKGLVVLTVARLAASEQYKGVDKLIEGVARIRSEIDNVHLVVVGGGDDLARHVSLAARLQVADCIHFVDNLSRDQIAACYGGCDVFAMPSSGEGFGLVFLEAMAFGKPLIGALAGGVPDVIEDGTNGFLVHSENVDELCQALMVLLKNDETAAKLGRNGAEIVSTKFEFGKFCVELESILRDCGLDSEI